MNEGMYSNKIVQDNIKKLKLLGYRFVGPRKGQLACGELGIGCLAEVEAIIKEVKRILW
jgi:phosphopantothenoylcysteine decarboxylase/phosphopantothenate--cysteine ligase